VNKSTPFLPVTILGLALFGAYPGFASEDEQWEEPVFMAQLPGQSPIIPPAAPKKQAPVVTPRVPLPAEIIFELTNTPNPFDSRRAGLEGKTEISYQLTGDYPVSLTIYDLLGYEVRKWRFQPGDNGARQGLNKVLWDGTNARDQKVSKGGYVATVEVETPQTIATALRKIGVIH
jgi:hypothetical protein